MSYRFGLFEFDPAAGELRKQGRSVRIEPQPARALALLLSRAGDVVSRDELRAVVWDAGTHVDFDRGLAYCLGQVRNALGDSADNPRFVETLPRRGYRFIAPVQPISPEPLNLERLNLDPSNLEPSNLEPLNLEPSNPDLPTPTRRSGFGWVTVLGLVLLVGAGVGWTTWSRATVERPRVAVAIFDNETGRGELDRLAATAADVMVERLTALGTSRVGVIGNTPTLRVPRVERDPDAIRRETGAGYFVIGQVQDDDAGVRLVVHLIRLDDGTHLWVTRIARPAASLADIQDVAADRLADAVRRHVIDRDPDAPRFTR